MNPNKQKQLCAFKTLKRMANIAFNITLASPIVAIVVISACHLIDIAGAIKRLDNLGVVICCIVAIVMTVSFCLIVEAERKIEDIKNPPADF